MKNLSARSLRFIALMWATRQRASGGWLAHEPFAGPCLVYLRPHSEEGVRAGMALARLLRHMPERDVEESHVRVLEFQSLFAYGKGPIPDRQKLLFV